jgi:hypothetical protein
LVEYSHLLHTIPGQIAGLWQRTILTFVDLPLGALIVAHAIHEPEPLERRRADVPAQVGTSPTEKVCRPLQWPSDWDGTLEGVRGSRGG